MCAAHHHLRLAEPGLEVVEVQRGVEGEEAHARALAARQAAQDQD